MNIHLCCSYPKYYTLFLYHTYPKIQTYSPIYYQLMCQKKKKKKKKEILGESKQCRPRSESPLIDLSISVPVANMFPVILKTDKHIVWLH